jgi:hypothetical protein
MADLKMPDPEGALHEIEESDVQSETWHLLGATPTTADIPDKPTNCPIIVTIDVAVDGTCLVVSTTE